MESADLMEHDRAPTRSGWPRGWSLDAWAGDASSDEPAPGLRSYQRVLGLGPVRVGSGAAVATWLRAPRPPAEPYPEGGAYLLLIPLRGTASMDWAGRCSTVGAGDVYPFDLPRLRRCVLRAPHDGDLFEGVSLAVPGSALSLPPHHVERALGRRLSGRDGIGALLAGFVTRLLAEPAPVRPNDGVRLGTALLDLVSALFAHALEADLAPPVDERRHALLQRVRAFIGNRLHDPRLSPGSIAAAHHVSTSYLHRLFNEQNTTVAAWIRDQRLDHARRDLADPALDGTPIHRIASRWGFTHPAAFSRAFRAAYGLAPRDFRQRGRQAAARGGPHPGARERTPGPASG
ncbi:helix-turn-helix domain-containing protein [Marinitenerispora sediminis]|nr:helix-turn-helix domain-containing protein [Marinitenerispora sediminis]